ncbi:hypothetical protein pb186bvf_010538 [Paramecium bursaria]
MYKASDQNAKKRFNTIAQYELLMIVCLIIHEALSLYLNPKCSFLQYLNAQNWKYMFLKYKIDVIQGLFLFPIIFFTKVNAFLLQLSL